MGGIPGISGRRQRSRNHEQQRTIWVVDCRPPSQVMRVNDKIKSWVAQKLSGECAAFRGKSLLAQLKETPIKLCFQQVATNDGVEKGGSKAAGYSTQWPSPDGKWSITKGGRCMVRGQIHLNSVTCPVEISTLNNGGEEKSKALVAIIMRAEEDRIGSLLPMTFTFTDAF